MAIQEQYILSKDPSTGTVLLSQVSNNTAFEIDNDGTGHGLYLHQDGILASNKYGVYIYSNAIQNVSNDSYLLNIVQDNASATGHVAHLQNDGTGIGLFIQNVGILADSSRAGLIVNAQNQQTASGGQLVIFSVGHSSSVISVLDIDNNGTGHGIYLHQDGVNASGKYGLYVYSNAVQVNSALFRVHNDNASSTYNTAEIINDGTGIGLEVAQLTVLAGGKSGLWVYSNVANVNADSALAKIWQDSASASEPALEVRQDGTGEGIEVDNNGTGHGLYLHQDGVLASNKHGLYVYSNAAQTNSALVYVQQDHASSDQTVFEIENDGDGATLLLDGNGNGIGLSVSNSGTGQGIYINNKAGTGDGIFLDNNGTNHGINITQDGVLASNKHGLYVYSNAVQVNSPLVYIKQDNASSTKDVAVITNNGSGNSLAIIGQAPISFDSDYCQQFFKHGASLDDTIDIICTFTAQAGLWAGHILEIWATLTDASSSTCYSSIVRYSITSVHATASAVVTDMTHDLVGGVTEGVSILNNVVTITLTLPGSVAIDYYSLWIKVSNVISSAKVSNITIS